MITIGPHTLEDIVGHARAEAPLECCGLLIGRVSTTAAVGSHVVVESSARMRNIRDSATRYQVDPAEHFAAIRKARSEGREIVGAYHSHPRSAPVPSPTDIAEAVGPGFLYVIVSLLDDRNPEIRGYRIDEGRVTAVPLQSLNVSAPG